jgi:hypothetical protein
MSTTDLELTGILLKSDVKKGRVRLCLVEDRIATAGGASRVVADNSWSTLTKAVPYTERYSVPYHFPLKGAPDDSGIRGECWVTLPSGRANAARRGRILGLAEELQRKEVLIVVRPKRYSFVSAAAANYGALVEGTALHFVGLEAVQP